MAKLLMAQVNEESRQPIIVAFGGRQYSRVDWRQVPEGEEKAAKSHPNLTVKTAEAVAEAQKKADKAAAAAAKKAEAEAKKAAAAEAKAKKALVAEEKKVAAAEPKAEPKAAGD